MIHYSVNKADFRAHAPAINSQIAAVSIWTHREKRVTRVVRTKLMELEAENINQINCVFGNYVSYFCVSVFYICLFGIIMPFNSNFCIQKIYTFLYGL